MTLDHRILLDVPLSGNLALGFDELAKAFRDVVETSQPQFAIGLYGSWGSGKTTLMDAIERQLDKKKCAVVRFSAWRYEKEQHLIVPLLDTIREGLLGWADINASGSALQAVKKEAATIGKAISSLIAGFSLKAGIPGGPEISYDLNKAITSADRFDDLDLAARVPRSFYHASFKALQEAFANFTRAGEGRRIVVFVDDLDRCLPEGALEVLESIKLFFDLPGFVFIVGLDLRVVETSVAKRYRDILSVADDGRFSNVSGGNVVTADVISGANYLRKIFQIPFTLPPVSTDQIDDFLQSIEATGNLPDAQWNEISKHVRPHLRYLTDAAGVNPREIKRFINSYTLIRKTKPQLSLGIVLALQTLAFRSDWGAIQFSLLAYRQAFIEAIKRFVSDPSAGDLEALGLSSSAIPQSFATYLEKNKPGHVLVSEHYDVNSYIYGGEATRSSISIRFLDIFREVGRLMPLVRKVTRQEVELEILHNAIGTAIGYLESSDEVSRASVILQDLNSLNLMFRQSSVTTLFHGGPVTSGQPDVKDRIEALEQPAIEMIQRVIRNLQQLYQAGTF